MLYEAKPWYPEPEMDLDLGIRMAQHYWCLGHREGAPQKNLDLLVDWMHKCRNMQGQAVSSANAAVEEMAPMGPMGPGSPPMGPEGPPMPGGAPPAGMPVDGPMPPPGMPIPGGM